MKTQHGGRHVFPSEEVWESRLSADRRESLGARSKQATGDCHARAARPAQRKWTARCAVAIGREVLRGGDGARGASRGGSARHLDAANWTGAHLCAPLGRTANPSSHPPPARRFTLPVERILFLTVLHRLFASGSDRSCLSVWKQDHEIPGSETIALHQIYRAMAWLGESLPQDQQQGATPFSPRSTKDAF